jgi:hypothetical protein
LVTNVAPHTFLLVTLRRYCSVRERDDQPHEAMSWIGHWQTRRLFPRRLRVSCFGRL